MNHVPIMRAVLVALALLHTATVATAQDNRPARRKEVTPELERSAFADPGARRVLTRARLARLAQDSALHSYDAKTLLRLSVGMGVRSFGADKLLLRTEQAARVRWAGGMDLWVEPTGARSAMSMGRANLLMVDAAPIPFFPGRESLWIPSGEQRVARAEVNENDLLHPLATGAEAYYRYATGDSLSFRLPDGKTISIRELRITARRPEWRAFVGSFWFDTESGSLVRAAYRLAADLDLWQLAKEEQKRDIEALEQRMKSDTGSALQAAKKELEDEKLGIGEKLAMKLFEGTLRPMRAKLAAVTVEYGLHEGRFWLPRLNVAEGEFVASFVRVPMKWEESFRYNSVNGRDSIPAVPAPVQAGEPADDAWIWGGGDITIGSEGPRRQLTPAERIAREDSIVAYSARRADSLRVLATEARAKGDTVRAKRLSASVGYYSSRARNITRRREACATDSTYYAGINTRYDGAVRAAVRMPCDIARLENSPDLPGSIYEPGETLFGGSERDALVNALGFTLQPGWGPQPPQFVTGLAFTRYNRVEGLSVGGGVSSMLGLGYTATGELRFGFADRIPNLSLALTRSNGRSEVQLGAFTRLGVANDDWGTPLSTTASLANAMYARDEGFYYRAAGAELAGTRAAPGRLNDATLRWRLFAERQRGAGVEPRTQASLLNALGDAKFGPNIGATRLDAVGVSAEVARTFGTDPRAPQLGARLRTEGAFTHRSDSIGTTGYGRVVFDASLSRRHLALTAAAGMSAGDLPIQRAFFLGGLHTVRGQHARLEGESRVGDAFWLVRSETAIGRAARLALFYDLGWAGARSDFARAGRPLSGAGIGLGLVDGLIRLDVARGIWPERSWRTDLYLGSRF